MFYLFILCNICLFDTILGSILWLWSI